MSTLVAMLCAMCGSRVELSEVWWAPASPLLDSGDEVPVHVGPCADDWIRARS